MVGSLRLNGQEVDWGPGVSGLPDPGQPQVPQTLLKTALPCQGDNSRTCAKKQGGNKVICVHIRSCIQIYWVKSTFKTDGYPFKLQ